MDDQNGRRQTAWLVFWLDFFWLKLEQARYFGFSYTLAILTFHVNNKSARMDTDSLKPCLSKTVSNRKRD